MELSRHNFEIELDEIGIPEDDKKSNGGRIKDSANYGSWVRQNDPIAFEVGYNEWIRDHEKD